MPADIQPQPNGKVSGELPPVTPPSGKFIVQLFLVPGLIVVGILAVLVPFVVWQSRPYRAEVLLEDLRSSNSDVRWRAAERLAQVLPRDSKEPEPRYAFDSKFALDLAEELRNALKLESEIRTRIGGKTKDELPKEHKELEAQQNLIRYLCGSLGHFNVPVTAPVLVEIATHAISANDDIALERQEIALLALANLGDNLKYFHQQPGERQQVILNQLEVQTQATGDRRRAAEAALDFLKYQKPMDVENALVKCAKSEYAAVRQLAAWGLTYWPIDEAQETLIELTNDDGHGCEPEKQPMYQREIRYQAVITLARHGSRSFDKHPDWITTLAEMLDEERQSAFNTATVRNKKITDENKTLETMSTAVRATAELHRQRPALDLALLKPSLEKLADHRSKTLKEDAGKLLADLNTTP